MKVCMIGTGYVGLVSATCFAEMGNDVVAMDIDEQRIARLLRGESPLFERGLQEMLERNLEDGRLGFTTDLAAAVRRSELIFIAVGTPTGESGASDLSFVMQAARDVAGAMNGPKIVINKSTVPVGTAERVRREIAGLTSHALRVVSNPEFLKEGAAVEDFMRPDRVIVGCDDGEAADRMRELYSPFTLSGAPILVMDHRSAEMTKYASNAMLATRISFINEIANLCEHVGADVEWVRRGMGLDPRIGRSFLFPGIGYGGSCFPKDIHALEALAREHHYPLELVPAVRKVNELQKEVLIEKMRKFYASELAQGGVSPAEATRQNFAFESDNRGLHRVRLDRSEEKPFSGRTFAIWGLSFKPQTDDIREAPSLVIIRRLQRLGARVRAYDPEAMEAARRELGDGIEYAETHYAALDGADALVLVTEWHLFRNPDFERVKSLLRQPVIFDGRNQYDPAEMREKGFFYFAIGR